MPTVSLASLLQFRTLQESEVSAPHLMSKSIQPSLSWIAPALLAIGIPSPATLMPRLITSHAPDFGVLDVMENGAVTISLPAFEPENQYMVARIVEFPKVRLWIELHDTVTAGFLTCHTYTERLHIEAPSCM